jgi:uncharacterized protein YfiM (DUF2279 family)
MESLSLRLLALAVIVVMAALALLPLALLFAATQPEPLVEPSRSAQQDDVGRIKALLQQHDPRDLRDGEVRTLTIMERDINLGLHSLRPSPPVHSMRVALHEGLARADYTVDLPSHWPGRYLNVALFVSEQDGELRLMNVRFGDLDLPGWMLAPLVNLADYRLGKAFPEYHGARSALQSVSLDRGEASFTYRWDRTLAKQLEQRGRAVLLPELDRDRALAYYQVLSITSRAAGSTASLATLLQPMFELARQRSGNGDAAAENRALLLVLGTVLNRSSVHRLIGGDRADLLPGHRYVYWTLHGRGDLAQHFAVSSAIAAAGGGVLADSIGVFKELDDSRDGTGFSFPDLVADRAGVELAEAAMGARASRVQEIMAATTLDEYHFIPPLEDMPEGLMEMAFRQRYSDLDDSRYAAVKREIDMRVARLPVQQ